MGLDGDLPEGWKQSFETTVKLLGDGEWGEVRLKKGTVRVKDIGPGSEEKLRHHLESIVTQANAAHEAREREAEQDEAESGDGADGDDATASEPDAEMTRRFQSFAENSEGADGPS